MFRTTAGGSSSKSDLEGCLGHERSYSLIDDKEALKDFQRSSASSSKSPDKESTPSDKKLGFPAICNEATKSSAERKSHTDGGTAFSFSPNGNRKSKDTTAIDIELQDNYLKTSSNSANGLGRSTNDAIINVEMPQNLKDMSSQLFNICKRGDIVCFLEEIDFLYEHKKNCLYNVLFSQNEEDQDTFLHVAIKGNNVDLVKEILHILGEPYNSDDAYECRYFKDKKENEKPLSKVINTKNREGKDVITLVIEGNNPECISAVFKYLTRKDINRRKDIESGYTPLHKAVRLKSSNAVRELLKSEHVDVELLDERSHKARKYIGDKETAKLFIKYYDGKIPNLSEEIASSSKRLRIGKYVSYTAGALFVFLIALGSAVRGYNEATEDTSRSDYITDPILSVTDSAGLVSLSSFLVSAISSCCYKGKNSRLRREHENCINEKHEVEGTLFNLRREEASSHTGAIPPRGFQVTSVSDSVYSPERPNIHIPY